ncbi:MAG: glycoside hydrolase family 31 protein [Deltaproteobacteria bacterium]|nr:glycoside hydrolase family 31 protein [Deltaproteobacteria bacterium]
MLRPIGLVFVVVVVAIGLAGCPPGDQNLHTIKNDSAVVDVTLRPFHWTVKTAAGVVVLDSISEPAGRYGALTAGHDEYTSKVVLSPGWDDYVEGVDKWHAFTRARLVETSDDTIEVSIDDDDGHAASFSVSLQGERVRLSAEVVQEGSRRTDLDKLSLGFHVDDDAHFFGGGERFGPLDHKGECLYAWAEEGGLGRGEDTPMSESNPAPNGRSMTYFPVPFFHGTASAVPAAGLSSSTHAAFGAWLDTTRRTEACFASERADAGRFTVNGPKLDVVVYVAADPLHVLDLYTADTGRPMVPAPWVWGPRRRVGVFSRVSSPALGIDNELEHEALRRFGVPTTGMDDAVHLLPARSELGIEPLLRDWTAASHDWGYKVMAYNNPYISTSIDSAAEDLAFGEANGLFLLDGTGRTGETFFISGSAQTLATIDLTNPAGKEWFKDLLRRSLALGYDGWMHDFGEYTEREWTAFDGSTGEELHNRFPVLSAQAAHELLSVERPDDFLIFVRSGYTGTQQFVPAVWGGDAESTFDESQGIPSAFRSGLSLALSGVPYWGSDTTGFKCLTDFPRDKEVYLRWAALSATSPIFMEQNACVGIDSPDKHTLWSDQETVDVYSAMARIHTRLQPLFRVLALQAHETGAPLLRHPFLLAPHDEASVAVDDAWFLGDTLYVAPALRRGMLDRLVYFPPLPAHGGGRYLSLRDFRVHRGGDEDVVDAPLDVLPLFLTEGRLLPLLDDEVQTLGDSPRADVVDVNDRSDVLDVLVLLGDVGEARLTLPDGTELSARFDGANDSGDLQTLEDLESGELAFAEGPTGDVDLLLVRGARATSSSVSHGGVTVEHRGAPSPLLVRWAVYR